MSVSNRPRPTMAVIADEAGVSIPTVSKVVNGHAAVASETRQRVEKVLRAHDYSPRTRGQTSRVRLIDLVLVDLLTQWGMEILAGVEETAHRAGYGVVVSAVHNRRRNRPSQQWLDNLAGLVRAEHHADRPAGRLVPFSRRSADRAGAGKRRPIRN